MTRSAIVKRLDRLDVELLPEKLAVRPKHKLGFVISKRWRPRPDGNGRYELVPLDLERSKCTRTLYGDTLIEMAEIYGNADELTDEQMRQWIESFPIKVSTS